MQCPHCGAGLSTEQLRDQDCPYCETALPHSVRAVESAQAVRELLLDGDGDGVPDVLQGTHLDPRHRAAPPRRVAAAPRVPRRANKSATRGFFRLLKLLLFLGVLVAIGVVVWGELNSFRSIHRACAIDANGDGIDDLAVTGYKGQTVRVGVLNGVDGTVLWVGEEALYAGVAMTCLSRDWFVVPHKNFQLDFHHARTPDPPVRVRASDRLRKVGLGQGCARYETADRSVSGVVLPAGTASECTAVTRGVTDDESNIQANSDNESSLTVGSRVYRLRARRSGTEMLTVTVLDGQNRVWSRELPYAKPTFGSGIAAAEGRVVVFGTPPGGEGNGHLIGLDEATGNQVYDVALTYDGADDVSFMHYNGRFLVMQFGWRLCAFDISTGKEAWCGD